MKGLKLVVVISIIVTLAALAGCQQTQVQAEPHDDWGIIRIPVGQTINIRLALSVTDQNVATLGTEQRHGAELAARQFDAIEGFRVGLDFSDAECSSDGGANAAHAAVGSAQTVGVVGLTCSSSCISAAPILDAAHVIEISPSCMAGSLTDPVTQREVFFTTSYLGTQEGEIAANFAYSEISARKVAIITYNNAETTDIINSFRTHFESTNATVVSSSVVVPGQFSFQNALNEAKAAKPDLIYAPLLPIDAVNFLGQLKKSDLKQIPVLGGRYYMSQWFADKTKGISEGLYAVGPNIQNDQTAKVYETFGNIYGEPPDSSEAAFAYDSMRLLLEGIKKVAVLGADNNLLIPRKALRDAMLQTADYQGLTGRITCTSWGDCAAPNTIVVARIRNAKWVNQFIP